jgi:hypothetical protein
MEAVCIFFITSVNLHQTKRRYITEYSTLLSHRCENHSSKNYLFAPEMSIVTQQTGFIIALLGLKRTILQIMRLNMIWRRRI